MGASPTPTTRPAPIARSITSTPAVAITRLDQPVVIDGNLTQNGHRVDFDVKIATLKTLLGDGTTALDLSLTSDMMQAGFKGGLGQDGALVGTLKFDTASLRRVIDWLGERAYRPAAVWAGRRSKAMSHPRVR
jgi:hypothetical protein